LEVDVEDQDTLYEPGSIEYRVVGVIADLLSLPKGVIELDHLIVEDLGADSLDFMEIAMGIENEFGLEINDDDVDKIRKVSDIVETVRERLKEQMAKEAV